MQLHLVEIENVAGSALGKEYVHHVEIAVLELALMKLCRQPSDLVRLLLPVRRWILALEEQVVGVLAEYPLESDLCTDQPVLANPGEEEKLGSRDIVLGEVFDRLPHAESTASAQEPVLP